jgi:hypothetical protein
MGSGEVRERHSEDQIRRIAESHTYQRSVLDVHREFDQLDPQAIGEACRGWKRAADELFALADDIKTGGAAPLSAAWSDSASPDAQKQLQDAEATARALGNDCLQMAHATDYAAQYAQWYKDNLPSYVDSVGTGIVGAVTGKGLDAAADEATQHMVNLLSRYNEVIQTLPPAVQATLAQVNLDSYYDERPLKGDGTHVEGPGGSPVIGSGGSGSYAGGSGGTGVHSGGLGGPGSGGTGVPTGGHSGLGGPGSGGTAVPTGRSRGAAAVHRRARR